jgi:DNA-binding NtrC family response regulator
LVHIDRRFVLVVDPLVESTYKLAALLADARGDGLLVARTITSALHMLTNFSPITVVISVSTFDEHGEELLERIIELNLRTSVLVASKRETNNGEVVEELTLANPIAMEDRSRVS